MYTLGNYIRTTTNRQSGRIYRKHHNFANVNETESWFVALKIVEGKTVEEKDAMKSEIWYSILVSWGGSVSIPESEIEGIIEPLNIWNPWEKFYFGDDRIKEVLPTYITLLEKEFLNEIAESDHSSDGHGLCGYPELRQPKVERGVMSSLVKKGIISIDIPDSREIDGQTWVSIMSEYQQKDDETDAGYRLVNTTTIPK